MGRDARWLTIPGLSTFFCSSPLESQNYNNFPLMLGSNRDTHREKEVEKDTMLNLLQLRCNLKERRGRKEGTELVR